ncbi:Ecotropic viral integration site 5 ortholog [Gryllus bimaculatus]|nr:Ecotropic viral integration site 5 ortholog [Gryllus bimaculatus]
MKTVSPVRERNSMPSMLIPSANRSNREVKLTFQPLTSDSNGEHTSRVKETCDSELNNNIRMWKEKRNTMGHPGHNFFKPLGTVSENSRSQSLPSCLENEKQHELLEEKLQKEEFINSQENVICDLKDDGSVCNQAWFKTWPERGCDKIINECMGKTQTSANTSSNPCHANVPLMNPQCSLSSNKSLNVNEQNNPPLAISTAHVVNGCSNYSHVSSLIHNHLTSDCDNAEQSVGKLPDLMQNEVKCSIPLSELLQNMPLAYSPLTRQLHIINQNYIPNSQKFSQNDCKDENDGTHMAGIQAVKKNGMKPLENIVEEQLAAFNFHQKQDSDPSYINVCDDSVSHESPRSTLQRIGAYDTSLSRTDASSFSSIVSSLSESSPSTNDDILQGNVVDSDVINCPTVNPGLCSKEDCVTRFEDTGAKPKRRGISSFFSRNVFSWKLSRDPSPPSNSSGSSCTNSPSWKLFGKAPKLRNETSEEEGDSRPSSGAKQYEDIVASSSALILHQRPSNLPAKSQDEEQKHRHEYERMVEAARKKEMKEAKLRKKQLQQQLKLEEQLASAARIWNNEVLPKWDIMKSSRKAQELWWQGIPPSVRGKVWRLAIGNDLNITHQLYNICVSRAQERLRAATELLEGKSEFELDNPDKEASVELIQLDIARTFPNLCIFQKGGPYYDILHCLLGAYVCYRPDVGYVQGMSFIAAILILNMEAADAFICFANLLNQPCHMAFFRLNEPLMRSYYETYNDFFRENLPRLFSHFNSSSLSADLYLLDWLYTVFAKAMPLDVACRVWDVFLRDGEEFLFKTALGVLHLHQDVLLQLDFLHGAQFLTKLPDDLAADQLFKSIESIHMNIGKLRFSEVLASHIENCREPS